MRNELKEYLESLCNQRSIPSALERIATIHPSVTAYKQARLRPQGIRRYFERRWERVSYASLTKKVWRLANYLVSCGLTPHTTAAIFSLTRPEWLIADIAIQATGATSVPIYHSLSQQDTGYILYDSGANIVFAENKELVDRLLWLNENLCQIPQTEDRFACSARVTLRKIITFETVEAHPLVVSLSSILENESIDDTPPETLSSVGPAYVASIVYTSGATGPAKGVIQTHANHLANIWQASHSDLFSGKAVLFLFLPLAHSFGRLIGYLGLLTPAGLLFPAVVNKRSSALVVSSIFSDIRGGKPTIVPVVPRILEKMMSSVISSAHNKQHKLLGLILNATVELANKKFSNPQKLSNKEKFLYFAEYPIRLLLKRKLFGGRLHHVVSGGAKLPTVVARFFWSLQIPVYEGYGLTETCVATNVHPRSQRPPKIGSVGKTLARVTLKIAEDGEICIKGPNVTRSYYNRPTATSLAWDKDGWFHTGDIGKVDEDGFLYITDRKKELIVNAFGKKIAPQPIEEKLKGCSEINQAIIYGEGRTHCIALIVPNSMQLSSDNRIVATEQQHKSISSYISQLNSELSSHERIIKWLPLESEFTIENGLLTPTYKIKRDAVYSRYWGLIEAAYKTKTKRQK